MRRDRAARYTFVALLVALAVLALSGLYLTFHYRPSVLGEHGARRTHRVVATAALLLVGALVLLERGRRRRLPVLGLAVALVGAVASGNELPWDQLALWAATVRDFSGVLPAAFDDTVRFVFRGRSEISQAAYRTVTLVHVAAIPALLAGFLFLARRVGAAGNPIEVARRNHGGRRHDVEAGPPQG